MSIENKLRSYIVSNYESVHRFCVMNDIPSSTMFTIFKKGIAKSNHSTVLNICRALKISPDELDKGEIVPIDKLPATPESDFAEDDFAKEIYDIEFGKRVLAYRNHLLSMYQRKMLAISIKSTLNMLLDEDIQPDDPDHD